MIDINLLKNMMKEIRENKNFLDSLSPNQFLSKEFLIKIVESIHSLDQEYADALGKHYTKMAIDLVYKSTSKKKK